MKSGKLVSQYQKSCLIQLHLQAHPSHWPVAWPFAWEKGVTAYQRDVSCVSQTFPLLKKMHQLRIEKLPDSRACSLILQHRGETRWVSGTWGINICSHDNSFYPYDIDGVANMLAKFWPVWAGAAIGATGTTGSSKWVASALKSIHLENITKWGTGALKWAHLEKWLSQRPTLFCYLWSYFFLQGCLPTYRAKARP